MSTQHRDARRVTYEQRSEHAVGRRIDPTQREIPAAQRQQALSGCHAQQRRNDDAREDEPDQRAPG
jgi:hypothetical protein